MSLAVDVRVGKDRAWGRWVTAGKMHAGESRLAGATMVDGEHGTWHASHDNGKRAVTLTLMIRRSPCSSVHPCPPDATESGIAGAVEDALRGWLLGVRRSIPGAP